MDDGIGEDALHKVLAEVFGESHYEIVKSGVIDIRENFNCVIRTCFEEDPSMTFFQQCESWKRKFVAAVHCNFIYWEQKVGKYYEFRKQYVCHLNSRNKSETGKRNLKCWARLEFKKLRIPQSDSTRWRDLKRGGFLSKGLDTEIKITFKHTHPVFDAQQLRLQRVTDDTRDAFEEYFSNGMGAAGAKAFHKMQILSNVLLPAEEQQMTLADASLNPTHRQIASIYENWR
nr:PREDICTED: uncharacterized protein LOC109032767 [Bemisia tabaci]